MFSSHPPDDESESPMPNPARRTIALAVAVAAIMAVAVALDLPSATAQSDEQTGRIVAQRLADGRTEFGWQPSGAERILPRARYFPADARVDRWLNSSPVEVEGEAIGRINARLRSDGRIEFAFTPTDGERIEPPARYFPVDARVGRWLRSTEITISAAPATGFVAVSAGGHHTCAIRAGSGAIECWGHHDVGQTDVPAGRFTAVSAGSRYTCAIRAGSGAIECWGDNSRLEWDETGTAAVVHGGQATPPAGRFTAVSAGSRHTCAIRAGSGAIECWGDNASGQTDAPEGSYTALALGDSQTCAIRAGSGAIECWGYKDSWYRDAPAGSFTAISAAYGHACAIRDDGAIECWGNSGIWSYVDDAGRLRDHETGLFDAPAGRFTAISSADAYACAIRDTGAISCWGLNGYPTKDTGEWQTSETGQTDAPVGRFRAVSTGQTHSCGLRESGAIECWGGKGIWLGQTDAPAP